MAVQVDLHVPWFGALLFLVAGLTGALVKNQTKAVAICINGGDTGFALRANASRSGDKGDGGMNTSTAIYPAMAVRRLTPTECERLQGFPDGYTDIKKRGKATPDGPRYKALGNSMAVPVMAWIGARIAFVDSLPK